MVMNGKSSLDLRSHSRTAKSLFVFLCFFVQNDYSLDVNVKFLSNWTTRFTSGSMKIYVPRKTEQEMIVEIGHLVPMEAFIYKRKTVEKKTK